MFYEGPLPDGFTNDAAAVPNSGLMDLLGDLEKGSAVRRAIADVLAAGPQIPTTTAQVAGLQPINRAARLAVSKPR